MSFPKNRPTRMLITSGELTAQNFSSTSSVLIETVRRAAGMGIEFIQIREKTLPGRQILHLTTEAVRSVGDSPTEILVNDRLDIAVASGAHGVHLTSTSLPVKVVRALLPHGMLVGVSTHSLNEIRAAREEGADYALFGPIYLTPGKGPPQGIEFLQEAAAAVDPFPVIAVGGIDGDNFSAVLDAGAAGFASIRYLNDFVNMSE